MIVSQQNGSYRCRVVSCGRWHEDSFGCGQTVRWQLMTLPSEHQTMHEPTDENNAIEAQDMKHINKPTCFSAKPSITSDCIFLAVRLQIHWPCDALPYECSISFSLTSLAVKMFAAAWISLVNASSPLSWLDN